MTMTPVQQRLIDYIVDMGLVDWSKEFTLKSGSKSPIYVSLRNLRGSYAAIEAAAIAGEELMLNSLNRSDFEQLSDIPSGATPFVSALCARFRCPQLTPHPPKNHGTEDTVDGKFYPGTTTCVWDDVATTGKSILEGLDRLKQKGVVPLKKVFVLLDRESTARVNLRAAGYDLYSILTLEQVVKYSSQVGKIEPEKFVQIMDYLNR